jgi:hypothetical protein
MNPYSFMLDGMVFSFSKLSTYHRCPYNFYLQYIKQLEQEENAFAQYGSFMHELLEKYAKDEILIFELLDEYKKKYNEKVTHDFPPNKYVILADTYYENGENYFSEFEGFNDYEMLEVEKEVHFKIDKYPFVGYIDLIAKNKDGEIEVIDHKSKKLSQPRKSTWEDIKKRRKSELYEYLRQLYIYCIPLIEQEKIEPEYLCFNSFRENKFIKIPFDKEDYEESKQWALNIIKQIYADEYMDVTYDNDFFCDYICGVRHYCPSSNKFLGEIVE